MAVHLGESSNRGASQGGGGSSPAGLHSMTWKIFNRLFKEEFHYCFVREAQPSVDFAFAILILL